MFKADACRWGVCALRSLSPSPHRTVSWVATFCSQQELHLPRASGMSRCGPGNRPGQCRDWGNWKGLLVGLWAGWLRPGHAQGMDVLMLGSLGTFWVCLSPRVRVPAPKHCSLAQRPAPYQFPRAVTCHSQAYLWEGHLPDGVRSPA